MKLLRERGRNKGIQEYQAKTIEEIIKFYEFKPDCFESLQVEYFESESIEILPRYTKNGKIHIIVRIESEDLKNNDALRWASENRRTEIVKLIKGVMK
jgi:hypothetical protein